MSASTVWPASRQAARWSRWPAAFLAGLLIALTLTCGATASAAAELPADGAGESCTRPSDTARFAAVVAPTTIVLADGRLLKLAGIESFALLSAEPEAPEAAFREALAAMLAGRNLHVRALSATADRHGRLIALVWAGDALVQARLAQDGLAIALAQAGPLPCFAAILSAEAEARGSGLGFWREQTVRSARPDGLAARRGRFAIVEDQVVSVGNRPGRTYLNFGRRWTEDFTVEIAARDRDAFGGEAVLAALAGSRIRVRGFLEERGGPMIVARSPLQIEPLDGGPRNHGKAP